MNKIDISKSALLLIDLQKEPGTSDVLRMKEIITKTRQVIESGRKAGIPIVYTRHINRSDALGLSAGEPLDENGHPLYYRSNTSNINIFDEIAPLDADVVIDKHRYSGFFDSSLDMILKSLGVKHIFIGGVLTEACVLATSLDAHARDYQVNVIKDICGSTNEGGHMSAILTMANWIYDINIFDALNVRKFMLGDDAEFWHSKSPESLSFNPESFRETYNKI